ncbi:MAG: hypothetical protein ACXW0T_08895 [Methylobacter sp.]
MFDLNNKKYLLLSSAVGILLAVILNYLQQGKINDDFVLYHEVARLFSEGNWKEGLKLYNWPLYPALLAYISKTGLSIYASAVLLSIALFGITCFSFFALVKEAGGEKIEIILAALILFSSSYIVGDILPMLIRDHGFWAFYISGLFFLLRYLKKQTFSDAVLWQICMLIATLFRIEAISFLTLLPGITAYIHKPNRYISIIKTSFITIALAIAISIFTLLSESTSLSDFGRLNEIIHTFQQDYLHITQSLTTKSALMSEHILGKFLDDYSYLALTISLISILLVKAASVPGWLTTVIALAAFRNFKLRVTPEARLLIYSVTIITLLNASMVLVGSFVLSGRYLISLAFVVIILASFQLGHLARTIDNKNKASSIILFVFLGVLFISLVINLMPKRKGFNYEQQAISWIKTYNSEKKPVFYVSPRSRYYAGDQYQGRGYDYWTFTLNAIKNDEVKQYEYLVINHAAKFPDHKHTLISLLPEFKLVKIFRNDQGKNEILIFKKIN